MERYRCRRLPAVAVPPSFGPNPRTAGAHPDFVHGRCLGCPVCHGRCHLVSQAPRAPRQGQASVAYGCRAAWTARGVIARLLTVAPAGSAILDRANLNLSESILLY